jgi:hypothetical protein
MQPHPPPTPGLQRRSVAHVYAASRHCEEASDSPQLQSEEAKTRGANRMQRRSVAKRNPIGVAVSQRRSVPIPQRREESPSGVAASQRCEDARSPPAASQHRRVAKTRKREEPQRRCSVAASRHREDASGVAASQRRDTAKTRKPYRSVTASQHLIASEPT